MISFLWLYMNNYYLKYLLNMLVLRNGFTCLPVIQINMYFHQMFKGRITENKVEGEHFMSLKCSCLLSVIHHRSGSKI